MEESNFNKVLFLIENEAYFYHLFLDKSNNATIDDLLKSYNKYQKGKITKESVLSKIESLMTNDMLATIDMPIITSISEFNGSETLPTRYFFDYNMYKFAKTMY